MKLTIDGHKIRRKLKKTPIKKTRLASWRALHADTDTWAEEILFKFYREAPAWRKLELADDFRKSMLLLAESGLKSRNPDASPEEIRRMMADMLLGPELAAKVYGNYK